MTYLASSAEFSQCRQYRYSLSRTWGDGPAVLWLMLNPSTADETANDPTVARCERRARAGGFGKLLVANIFALRSTDPAALYKHDDPEGPENDWHIQSLAEQSQLVICGWGNHGRYCQRGANVMTALQAAGHTPHALRMTKARQPNHPLYVAYSVDPRPITELLKGAA